jgi:hypothetical protein
VKVCGEIYRDIYCNESNIIITTVGIVGGNESKKD